MNFLAHLHLTSKFKQITIGNFIADFIKGNNYKHLPQEIQNGILIHRKTDSYTDTHKLVKQIKRRLHKRYGLYKGIIIDILYDHFLAKNWKDYSDLKLIEFENEFHSTIQDYHEYLPEKVLHILPYMKNQKWLSSYATIKGIEKALIGMNKRTKDKSQMHIAINDLNENYNDLESDFKQFYDNLILYIQTELSSKTLK